MSEHVLSILVKALGLGQTSAQMKSLDHAIGSVSKTAEKGHAALTHLGGRIGQLAGAAGIVGVTGAAFGFAGALEQGIEKTSEMALAVEKLTGVTGIGAHEASQYVAVFEKFGISTDRAITIAGFAEKTLGKLAAGVGSVTGGVSKLTKFEQLYGIVLHDNTGKAVGYGAELGAVADYYNSNHTAGQKAAVAATLFGKGYVALIPILKLGSKGIAEAAAEADKLGLTLRSAEDVKNVHDFIAAQRGAKDAIAGLEVQLGLLVMPDLTGALKNLTAFVGSHRAEIQDFFRNGIKVAEGLASFVTGTLIPSAKSVADVFVNAWNAIPAPLRDMIVKGAIADRTVKFLFGFSPIHTILDIGGSLLAKGLSAGLSGLIGKNIVQPVFVTNQVPGGGGLPGAAGKAGGGLLSLASGVVALLGVGAVEIAIAGVAGDWLKANVPGWGTAKGAAQVGPVTIGGQSQAQAARAAADAAKAAQAAAAAAAKAAAAASNNRSPGSILDRGGREKGFSDLAGKMVDDRVAVTNAIKAFQASLTPIQRNAVSVMNRMLGSTGSVSDKIAYLNRLQARFAARGDTTLQNVVKGKISALQAAETARLNAVRDRVEAGRHATVLAGNKVSSTARKAGEVARSGGDHAAAAIARKKMSVTVPVSVSWTTQLKLNGQQIAREDNRRSRTFAINV